MKVFSARFSLLASVFFGLFFSGSVPVIASTQAISPGQLVTLTATADGTAPFTYQWYKNGNILAGATGSTYTLNSFQAADAGTYTATISNSAGSTNTDDATLTLYIANVAPVFTTQPIGQTVTSGGSVIFIASASGTPSPTFQWKKDGSAISGATDASYSISGVAAGNAGSYTVVATNSAGSVTSNTATLTVTPAPVAPVFTTQPVGRTVTEGGYVTFTAAASGLPSPTFQWKKNGSNISGATSASYILSNAAISDAGSYTVVATNSVGAVTSNAANLIVNAATVAPVIVSQPGSQTVVSGNAVTFLVTATGIPSPTYRWRKNGSNISGATSASYSISSTTTSSAGTYSVVVTNSAGSVTSSGAVLTVNSSPSFTIQPVGQTVTAGDSVTFTASASGSPAPTFQWKRNGSAISGATAASYALSNVTSANAGSYTVVATNAAGSVTSATAALTVNPASTAPVFTSQPVGQTVVIGNPVTLTATATGTPSPSYQWKKNGVTISGATGASYTLANAALTDEASYTVVASNTAGSVTSNAAVLSVNVAPKNVVVTLSIQ